MDKVTYIYFGDDLFQKLHKFTDLNYSSYFKCQRYKMFNSVDSLPDAKIDDVFLGWSYIIYQTGSIYNHVGFVDTTHNFSEIFDDYPKGDLNITCGANEVFAVSNGGKLFHYSTQNLTKPLSISIEQNVKSIITGDFQTLVLLEDGSVFILNLREKSPLIPLNVQCYVIQVACGKEHSILLSNSGQVFSYGCGSRGQLGHGTIESQNEPLLLEALDGIVIKTVACGGWHSAAISNSGDLYMWGWNESGQLGFPCAELHNNSSSLNEIETVCCLPKIVDLGEEKLIVSVSCGSRHTAIITDNFEVWSWGWNEYGQLGNDKHLICDKPHKVSLPSEFLPQGVKCAFWSTVISGKMTINFK